MTEEIIYSVSQCNGIVPIFRTAEEQKTYMHSEKVKYKMGSKIMQAHYYFHHPLAKPPGDLVSQLGMSLSNPWQQNMQLGVVKVPWARFGHTYDHSGFSPLVTELLFFSSDHLI